MKYLGIIMLLVLASTLSFSQNMFSKTQENKKGSLYAYWGWNRGWYSNSDIHFTGNDYDFQLDNVVAHDRQSTFDVDTYLNPMNISIPQYNFRVGYFINDNYDISFGVDHMKYVVDSFQTVQINGNIANSGTGYDGIYNNDDIILAKDFLQLEHTDGLNYVNLEFRRFDEVYRYKNASLNLTEGFGAGILFPRTAATLLNKKSHDEFHVAGFGLGGVVAANITFYNHFFIQSEFKLGYINMPDVQTTYSDADKARQSFFFYQWNVALGVSINLIRNK